MGEETPAFGYLFGFTPVLSAIRLHGQHGPSSQMYAADIGNARILSVKLGYHTEEKVALRDVQDAGK